MGQITEKMKKYKKIAFDTNLFIYLIEKHKSILMWQKAFLIWLRKASFMQ